MRLLNRERLAWLLVTLLSGFWVWFGLASALGEGFGIGDVILRALIPGGVFAIVAAIAWRWRLAGALLLVATGILVVAGYPFVDGEFFPTSTLIFVLFTMAAPPIAAGVLLFETRRKPRH